MFADELPLSIDSTDTFPMSIHGVDSNKKKITNHQFTYIRISPFGKCITKRLLDQTSLNPVYGTVRIGFNLSKDRIMSDIHLVHSLSKLYDNCSLLYLKNLGKQIEPAHENGQLVYSYSEIDFKYDDVLNACDKIQLFKLVVKTIARKHGLYATFMAKPKYGIAGSGMHCNMSLFGKDGQNARLAARLTGAKIDIHPDNPVERIIKPSKLVEMEQKAQAAREAELAALEAAKLAQIEQELAPEPKAE